VPARDNLAYDRVGAGALEDGPALVTRFCPPYKAKHATFIPVLLIRPLSEERVGAI
jgi:hypothetical protein